MSAWFDSCERKWGPLLAQRRAEGAIDPSASKQLDRHVAGCARCRALARDVDALAGVLAEAGKREPMDHPEPEDLAALATRSGALPPAERQRIEAHLETCATCRSEWNAATQWAPPAAVPRREVAAPSPWTWFGAGAAAAAAAAAIVATMLWPGGVDGPGLDLRPSASPVQIRGSHHRAADEPTAVRVPASGEMLVSLTVEAAPGAALRVELVGPDGTVVSSGRMAASDPSGLVFVSVPAVSIPRGGGEFRVVVEATGDTFDYPFRVVADAE